MKAHVVVALLLAAALAGCSDDKGGGEEDALAEAAKAAADLDVDATSTTGVIRGVVVDEAIRPLPGVFVSIQSSGTNATTNENGAFAFEGLEAGTYFLQASLPGYFPIQQSADVVAGVDQPEAIRILLAAIPSVTPYVEALQATLFVDIGVGSQHATALSVSGLLSEHGLSFRKEIQPNATVAQSEIKWNPTTPLAETILFQGGTWDGNDRIHWQSRAGTTPMVFRNNGTNEDGEPADRVGFSAFAWGNAGLLVNQQMDVFIHVFHGFQPDPNWVFGRDGDHPVPGG